ncbi:hypothetical protein [Leptospira noguchii]|uniref:Uncharacterized protein n=1 Tax=Leptospira noguchii serovar Autumnalis str. ZUN142 TaxID=1085540 RepID=M6UE82_9LEPT|nr:hypothetical protein [Leptospira noguchii]EKR74129.1 hypothetical protein LEP1GSC041_3524 [Leptospira noguchii str. 2006001870]EMO25673.1 hypothetical protein LEP1GSC170_1555 [Leptospira interrogans serovar Bataviae str. HAI135]EMO42870.1 hypothetical protein LEP1GSC186_0120 [Leptospira noguchii serovar Autumnalis str. ZUN142]
MPFHVNSIESNAKATIMLRPQTLSLNSEGIETSAVAYLLS